ncbi:hypothetical protein Rumeso_00900 [Rubellimicrobium mesophilum DSM 19309]|uniref:Uncharacterized protein n=1 Tax=Rubellimicrobium mesophilum DSM 19309 TaxID=442562 RepID=A0A017HT23_9RHOB|nr:hypothetical protein [Rubellimicrobium mesophilum]EYD77475.1 hypothetical protein Rumeso_00900 [Rubellimicrobium mesophilum DSM 19309]
MPTPLTSRDAKAMPEMAEVGAREELLWQCYPGWRWPRQQPARFD